MQKVELTDDSLVSLLKNNDTKAFEIIYRRYWHQLYGFVYQQTGSKEEAEEILQELMLSLWQNRAQSRIQNLSAFLFIAARNLTNRYFRKKINLRKYREYQLLHEVFENIDIDHIFNENQLSEAIEKVLSQLPEKTATIFRMNKINELSVKVIAAQMGLSDKAVEYHITKSLKMVRQRLNEFVCDN
ncbi:sigma-70 family RNA polymerase sigma factor [Runella sp. MFBS21]|uniref:RNA polymerase sigma factor n=1 Tax=Runella sp. MFBS21 TaxID=3034018 RepID=UPI0023F9A105|nr:sigma-70 family RNA polymerase sigma factor [Runella sp. MFBS21]MDF7819285.1 sigma-70 family RNA polymerase sigma factor [Runella sp. MFBS21]